MQLDQCHAGANHLPSLPPLRLRARQDDSHARLLRRVSHHGRNILPTQRWKEPQDRARLVRPAARTVGERRSLREGPSGLLEREHDGVICVLSEKRIGGRDSGPLFLMYDLTRAYVFDRGGDHSHSVIKLNSPQGAVLSRMTGNLEQHQPFHASQELRMDQPQISGDAR